MNHTTTLKINWDLISRIFIGTLFIYAGINKLMHFADTSALINAVMKTGGLSSLITGVAIFIEIVIAALFVLGKWKKDLCGYILITFTALATIFFHSDFSNAMNVLQAGKNLAIIGGIMAMLNAVHNRRFDHRHNGVVRNH